MFHLYQEDIFDCEKIRDIPSKSKIERELQDFQPFLEEIWSTGRNSDNHNLRSSLEKTFGFSTHSW